MSIPTKQITRTITITTQPPAAIAAARECAAATTALAAAAAALAADRAVTAAVFAVSWGLYFLTGKEKFRMEPDDRYAYAAAGIVILNFIIKNGLLVFAGIDVIGRLPGV